MIIKTERRLLARLIDFLLTLLAWCCLLYLFGKAFLNYVPAQESQYLPKISLAHWGVTNTLTTYLLVVFFNALLLIVWARYNQFRFRGKTSRRPFEPLTSQELSQHFEQTPGQLKKLRQARISTLEHDEAGTLVAIHV